MTEAPRTQESSAVQLTRIEGLINGVAKDVAHITVDVSALRADLKEIQDRVLRVEIAQAASTGATASWKTTLPLIFGFVSVVIASAVFLTR